MSVVMATGMGILVPKAIVALVLENALSAVIIAEAAEAAAATKLTDLVLDVTATADIFENARLALVAAKEATLAAMQFYTDVMVWANAGGHIGFSIFIGCIVVVGIILLCIFAYWIYSKYINLPDKTFEEIQTINNDYKVVDKAYDEMIRIAPSAEIKDAYITVKKSGLRYRDELPKGFKTYKHGYKLKAFSDNKRALNEVKNYVKEHPEETTLLEKARCTYENLHVFEKKHDPTWVRPFYGFMDLEK